MQLIARGGGGAAWLRLFGVSVVHSPLVTRHPSPLNSQDAGGEFSIRKITGSGGSSGHQQTGLRVVRGVVDPPFGFYPNAPHLYNPVNPQNPANPV